MTSEHQRSEADTWAESPIPLTPSVSHLSNPAETGRCSPEDLSPQSPIAVRSQHAYTAPAKIFHKPPRPPKPIRPTLLHAPTLDLPDVPRYEETAAKSAIAVFSSPEDPWTECISTLRNYDDHMIKGWKEDVDSLLIFAGLFSAVTTAFNIESYKLLQEDPDETSVNILRQIALELSNNTTSSSTIAALTQTTAFRPEARAVRINILWFSSLVLSLTSASIGILTKQWLREYISDTASSPRENARIRQLRYEGFLKWRIPLTIALLPFFLQVAMALFFAGLLDLLWSLNSAVAGVTTVFVAGSLSFLVLTTITPTIRSDCPYKSPQAMGVFLLVQVLRRILSSLAISLYSWFGWNRREWPLIIPPDLFNVRRRRFAAWLVDRMHKRIFGSWRDREKEIVRKSGAQLDHHVLAGADAAFMDHRFLEGVVRSCMKETSYSAAVECVAEIITHRADGVKDGIPHWRHSEHSADEVDVNPVLLHLVLDVLPRIKRDDEPSIMRMLTFARPLCEVIPFASGNWEMVDLCTRVLETMSCFLDHGTEDIKRHSFFLMRSVWRRIRAPVAPEVFKALICHAQVVKEVGDLDAFYLACEMVLTLSTEPLLPHDVFNNIREELQKILEDLEPLLISSDSGVNALATGQSAAIIVALEELAVLDPELISPSISRMLDRLTRIDNPASDDNTSLDTALRRRLASAREMRKFRQIRPRWPDPTKRRNALDPEGAARIQDSLDRTQSQAQARPPNVLIPPTDANPGEPPLSLRQISPESSHPPIVIPPTHHPYDHPSPASSDMGCNVPAPHWNSTPDLARLETHQIRMGAS